MRPLAGWKRVRKLEHFFLHLLASPRIHITCRLAAGGPLLPTTQPPQDTLSRTDTPSRSRWTRAFSSSPQSQALPPTALASSSMLRAAIWRPPCRASTSPEAGPGADAEAEDAQEASSAPSVPDDYTGPRTLSGQPVDPSAVAGFGASSAPSQSSRSTTGGASRGGISTFRDLQSSSDGPSSRRGAGAMMTTTTMMTTR